MLKILKDIKKGAWAKVVQFDETGNVYMSHLYYNQIGRSFYLANNRRGVQRKSITKRTAEYYVRKTLELKND
jgi:hypothetical protein